MAGPDDAVFYLIHRDLPREGPGDRTSLLRALALMTALPPQPDILDIACGPGAQTLDLATYTDGRVTALDSHLPYLQQLEAAAVRLLLSDRITTVEGDMRSLPFSKNQFDLIWCEGAIYLLGVPAALQAWKPFLKPGGYLAFSDAVWLREDPPEPARAFWLEYPDMQTIGGTRERIHQAGYDLVGNFILPTQAWWELYYDPLSDRLRMLKTEYADDPAVLAAVVAHEREIDLYRTYSEYYGYAFFICRRPE